MRNCGEQITRISMKLRVLLTLPRPLASPRASQWLPRGPPDNRRSPLVSAWRDQPNVIGGGLVPQEHDGASIRKATVRLPRLQVPPRSRLHFLKPPTDFLSSIALTTYKSYISYPSHPLFDSRLFYSPGTPIVPVIATAPLPGHT